MRISRAYQLFTLSIALLLLVTGLVSFLALGLQNETVRTERHRRNSYQLAHELLQSSEDLTRMARSFAATGNPVYEEHYQAILDIRNGKRPRPARYDSTYWHLAGIGRGPSEGVGETVALQELMRRERFTAAELSLLRQSQAQSDHLVSMEREALAAVKGFFDDGRGGFTVRRAPDAGYAVRILFGDEYVDEKAAIMAPIRQFMETVDRRTNSELLSYQRRLREQILLTLFLILVTFCAVCVKTIQTYRTVLYPVKRLLGNVGDVASGNYDARCVVDSSNEVGDLCEKFNDMALALQTDIARRKKAEEALQESLDTIHGLLESVDAGIVVVDPATHRIEQANSHAAALFGVPRPEIEGRPCHDFLCPTEKDRCPITDLALAFESRECSLRRADGSLVHILKSVKTIRLGGQERLLETFVDITKRKEAEEQVRHLANHDGLTGLSTMRLARDFLSKSLDRSRRNGSMTAVLFVDLDGFKAVNDDRGHDAGDRVLREVATRFLSCVRKSDTVARIGGDEFLVIVDDILESRGASGVADKIVGSLSSPVSIEGGDVRIGASIGIALFPADGDDPDALIKKADEAMYRVKKAGKNGFGFVTDPAG